MNRDCREFRSRLAALLAGARDPARLAELGWEKHLLGCGACRELLEQEEALEVLLASLPDPQLPPELAARVIARLRERREHTLDELLALDEVGVPPGLADSVRARLRAARPADRPAARPADRLERLLDLLPEPRVPVGLAARVLAGLQAELGASGRPLPTLTRAGLRRPVLLRAAALFLISLTLAGAWRFSRPRIERQAELGFDDEEVIANLPVLEYWDLLEELEPLEQDLITRLDLSDEALLDTEDS